MMSFESIIAAIVAFGVAVLAAFIKGKRAGKKQEKAKQNEDYVETSNRIADEPAPSDADEFLRDRKRKRGL